MSIPLYTGFFQDTIMAATTSIIYVPELVLEILGYCDLPEIAAFSMSGKHARELAERHIQDRVRDLFGVLFPDNGEQHPLSTIQVAKQY